MSIIKEKLYTLDSLITYANDRVKGYIQEQSAVSSLDNDIALNKAVRTYTQQCHCGDESDKMYVKHMISRFITEENRTHSQDFPPDYCVSRATINRFIPWDDYRLIDPYILFLAILFHYKEQYEADALGAIIDRYGFNKLRDRGGQEGAGFFISEQDVLDMWEAEQLNMDYEQKFDVLLQLVYEETYGNSCIDELLYQNIGDVSFGVSGVPSDINLVHQDNSAPAYSGCWVRYRGCAIHFMFVSFGSYERMKTIAMQMVDYQARGQFSEKEGRKLGYGKDGSRRTAAIDPFGECPAAWVRKFTEKTATNEGLYKDVPGHEIVTAVEQCLVRGGATIPICGDQGAGKTTKLESLVQYIQNFYAIRVLETEFELRLRWKYPLKNIYSMESNDASPVSPAEAYTFSLRTAGDIYVIGEARSDSMIVNVTRTANRGGRSVVFTFHPNSPALTIPEVANAMIREKLYTSLGDAMLTALETVQVCIFVTTDIEEERHYYEVYEFVPRPRFIPTDFLSASNQEEREAKFMESVHAWMQAMANANVFYDTVPIVTYDRVIGRYVMKNTISDRLYDDLLRKTPLQDERMELMRVFRPSDYLRTVALRDGVPCDESFIKAKTEYYSLDKRFLTKQDKLLAGWLDPASEV